MLSKWMPSMHPTDLKNLTIRISILLLTSHYLQQKITNYHLNFFFYFCSIYMDRWAEDGITLGLLNFRTDQSTCTFVFVSYNYNISLLYTGHDCHFHCLGLKAMTWRQTSDRFAWNLMFVSDDILKFLFKI